MFLGRFCSLVVVTSLVVVPMYPQTAAPGQSVPLFRIKARTVLVDVVVTDSDDQPIAGLRKEDFAITDKGVPQTITYFEEHTGVTAEEAPTPAAPLPPGVFTNRPPARVTDSVNVLLLDSLNTPIEDQSYVHTQAMKYLKNAEPATRLAIFTLGDELRFIQGFTADAGLLAAALNKKSSTPEQSALLPTEASASGEAQQVGMMNQALQESNVGGHGGSADIAGAMAALQQFQAETHSFETDMRLHQTLFAFQQLARYLAGVPGRKNVIWFSGSFPVSIFPSAGDFNAVRSYEDEIRKTDELMAFAQVSIYPIAAGGVENDEYNTAEHNLGGMVTNAREAIQDQSAGLHNEAVARNGGHTAMDIIAHDTGGEAFYGTNGIGEAIARVMHNGARYYTLAYTPTSDDNNGSYHALKVTVNVKGKFKLAYRRGYYAGDVQGEKIAGDRLIPDPLHPFMGHGMPDSTQIPYTLNLVTSPNQASPASPRAGDNPNFKGPSKRYQATFWLPVGSLKLDSAANGDHSDSLEAALVVYDHQGNALNWIVRMVNLTLKPERYAAALQVGIPLRVEIDAPPGETYLRTGIYENSTRAAGTIEVPLSEVPPVVASK